MKLFGLLFSVIGVWAIRVIGALVAFFMIYKVIKRTTDANRFLKTGIIVVGYIGLFFVSKPLLLSNYSSPSDVDISPLYALSDIEFIDSAHIGAIMNTIEARQDFSSVKKETGAFDIYTFAWNGDKKPWEPGGVSVTFWHFYSSDEAKILFGSDVGKYVHITISDYIEANLFNSIMYRASDSFYVANWKKNITTNIIIGNLMIIIHEKGSFRDIGKYTSQSIEILCEIINSAMQKN
ncbi:MAG: hypothetical protein FWH55_09350 [Oscillospiraceae bacterium]|nr:hypothetical protein [Oscillospiraceae bacterium]